MNCENIIETPILYTKRVTRKPCIKPAIAVTTINGRELQLCRDCYITVTKAQKQPASCS